MENTKPDNACEEGWGFELGKIEIMCDFAEEMNLKECGSSVVDANVLVSICCITYNHADYIADALNGFLAQKTTFSFEILVHDDASDDGTQETLKDFESRYPSIIHVYYEKENQYHKDTYPEGYDGLLVSHAAGKYIALCEGDDYWYDSKKLQKQVEYLEQHPDCTMTGHAAYILDCSTTDSRHSFGRVGDSVARQSDEEVVLRAVDLLNGGCNIPTASRLIRKTVYLDYVKTWAKELKGAPVGDYPQAIFCAHSGPIHFSPEPMSVYRWRTPGSYSESVQHAKKRYEVGKDWYEMYGVLDSLTSGHYHSDFLALGRTLKLELISRNINTRKSPFDSEVSKGLSVKKLLKARIRGMLWRIRCDVRVNTNRRGIWRYSISRVNI